MKTLKLTLAAVVLSAFTMTAQQDAKAATKTEVSKEVKEEVRAPHKMDEQRKAAELKKTTKPAVKAAAGQDSDVAKKAAPGTVTKKAKTKVKAKAKKAALTQDEKAAQKAGVKNDN